MIRAPFGRALSFGLVSLVVASCSLLTPAPTPSPSGTAPLRVVPVRIVVSLPRGGARRAQSDGVVDAIRLAVAEVDGRVGATDVVYSLGVDVLDSTGPDGVWTEALERANVERAVADASTVAYVGPATAAAAKIVAAAAGPAGLAVVAPTLTHPAITKRGYDDALYDAVHPGGKTVIARTIPSDDVGVAALLRWAKDAGAVPAALAVADGSDYAATLAAAYRKAAADLGISGDAAAAKLRYVAAATPEAAASAVSAAAGVTYAGSEILLSDAFVASAAKNAVDARATFVGRPLDRYSGAADRFARAYADRFVLAPDPYAIFGYDSARLIVDALRRSGAARPDGSLDRARVRDAVFATRQLTGALGTWGLDAGGDTTYRTFQLYALRALPGRIAWVWEREVAP